jgi:hypothetical protein
LALSQPKSPPSSVDEGRVCSIQASIGDGTNVRPANVWPAERRGISRKFSDALFYW